MLGKYNLIAGQDLTRVSALSDGVFSFAMTLLVLDLRVPLVTSIHSEGDLLHALAGLAPRLIPYVMTFMTLGIFWVAQQTQFSFFQHSDRNLAWINIAFLFAITLTPFSTALLAEYLTYRSALLVYWFNILLLGVLVYANWAYGARAGLLKPDTPPGTGAAILRRIQIAQLLYAFGAALCAINTYVSIGFIVLVQLNYTIAPRVRFLQRL